MAPKRKKIPIVDKKNLPTMKKVDLNGSKSDKVLKKKKKLKNGSGCPPIQEIVNLAQEQPLPFPKKIDGSIDAGNLQLQHIIHPTTTETFFNTHWERKLLWIKRKCPAYFSNLISLDAIDQMLKLNVIEYGKDIDITLYENGERTTLNSEGRALPSAVWDQYNDGCSIRLLNPAKFFHPIYHASATLQEFFHCFVGANVYLTPPNSQGFAPHYDDIEAFILQVEGKKRWRVYKPRSENEKLPCESSANLDQNDIGQPIFDEVLEAGHVLYFPRGFIHQAHTVEGEHSLHITFSAYQKNTWAEFAKQVFNDAIDAAVAENLEFRRGLPIDIHRHLGAAFSNTSTSKRETYKIHVLKLLQLVTTYAQIDDSMDQYGKKYQQDALSPLLESPELQRTVYGRQFSVGTDKKVVHSYQIEETTEIRLVKANILRLCKEDGVWRVYFHNDNTRVYQEAELNYFEASDPDAVRIAHLIQKYPNYIRVDTLPFPKDESAEKEDSKESQLTLFAQDLFDKGLVMFKE